MSEGETTEVYICQKGESVQQGALELRPEIASPAQAEADAAAKCDNNKRIEKVFYYRVSATGDSKLLLKYDNPYFLATTDPETPTPDAAPGAKRAPRAKPALTQRLGKNLPTLVNRFADRLLFEDEPQGPQPRPAATVRSLVDRLADMFSQK